MPAGEGRVGDDRIASGRERAALSAVGGHLHDIRRKEAVEDMEAMGPPQSAAVRARALRPVVGERAALDRHVFRGRGRGVHRRINCAAAAAVVLRCRRGVADELAVRDPPADRGRGVDRAAAAQRGVAREAAPAHRVGPGRLEVDRTAVVGACAAVAEREAREDGTQLRVVLDQRAGHLRTVKNRVRRVREAVRRTAAAQREVVRRQAGRRRRTVGARRDENGMPGGVRGRHGRLDVVRGGFPRRIRGDRRGRARGRHEMEGAVVLGGRILDADRILLDERIQLRPRRRHAHKTGPLAIRVEHRGGIAPSLAVVRILHLRPRRRPEDVDCDAMRFSVGKAIEGRQLDNRLRRGIADDDNAAAAIAANGRRGRIPPAAAAAGARAVRRRAAGKVVRLRTLAARGVAAAAVAASHLERIR